MEDKLLTTSFLSLQGTDSGVTLVTTDSLVRKNGQLRKEVQEKTEKIEDLEETVGDLQDIINKCEFLFSLSNIFDNFRLM